MSTKEKKLVDEDSTFERASKYNLIYAIIRQAAANNTEANTGVFPDAPTNEEISEHGMRVIGIDGMTTLTWKGLPIVEWDAMPMRWSDDGMKATITFRKA